MKRKQLSISMLVLGLVAFGTFAFTPPKATTGLYAQDPQNPSIWYDLTEVVPGDNTYRCINNGDCLRDEPEVTGTVVQQGMFVKNSENLPIAD